MHLKVVVARDQIQELRWFDIDIKANQPEILRKHKLEFTL